MSSGAPQTSKDGPSGRNPGEFSQPRQIKPGMNSVKHIQASYYFTSMKHMVKFSECFVASWKQGRYDIRC